MKIKDTISYLLANIFCAAVPFILLPILTRYLTPEEYGSLAMFLMLIMGSTAVVGLNINGVIARNYYDMTSQELAKMVGSCFHILFITTVIVLTAAVIFEEQLNSLLQIEFKFIVLAILVASVMFVSSVRLSLWQLKKKVRNFVTFQITNALLTLIFVLVSVVFFNLGLDGRVYSQVVVVTLLAVVAVLALYNEQLISLFHFSKLNYLNALKFGVPLVPHAIGLFILASVDRYFINQEMGLASAGIYMAAFQLSTGFRIMFDAINRAFIPHLFDVLSENNLFAKRQIIVKTYQYFIILIFIGIISVVLGPSILNFIVGSAYGEASEIIGLLCVGQIFGGMYLMVVNYLFYEKKTALLSFITITSGVLQVGLLYYLLIVESYGFLGVASAFCIAKFIQFIGTWLAASYLVKMPWLLNKA